MERWFTSSARDEALPDGGVALGARDELEEARLARERGTAVADPVLGNLVGKLASGRRHRSVAGVRLEGPVGEHVVRRALQLAQRLVEQLRLERVDGAEGHRPVADVDGGVRPARRDHDLVARPGLDHDHVGDVGRRPVLHVDEAAAVPELVDLRVGDAGRLRRRVHVALRAQRLAAERAVVVDDRAVAEAERAQRRRVARHADVHVDRVEVVRAGGPRVAEKRAHLVEAADRHRSRRDAGTERQSQGQRVEMDRKPSERAKINHDRARFSTKRATSTRREAGRPVWENASGPRHGENDHRHRHR